MIDAFPFDSTPGYPLRDSDSIFADRVPRRIDSLGIRKVVTAPASPWQSPYMERVIGSLRRELLHHVVVFNARHLKRLLTAHLDCYHPWRTHQSMNRDAPDGRPIRPAETGKEIECPAAHELHRYHLSAVA